MESIFGLYLVLVIVVQTCNLIYRVLTKLHLTAAYHTSTEAILKDLNYTMDQYLHDAYIRYLVTQEFIERLKKY